MGLPVFRSASSGGASFNSGNTASFVKPAGIQAGDVVDLIYAFDSGTENTTTMPSPWVLIGHFQYATSASASHYYRVVTQADVDAIATPWASNALPGQRTIAYLMSAMIGCDPLNPLHLAGSFQDIPGGNTWTVVGITTTIPNCLVNYSLASADTFQQDMAYPAGLRGRVRRWGLSGSGAIADKDQLVQGATGTFAFTGVTGNPQGAAQVTAWRGTGDNLIDMAGV